jgi:hypothetical protein
MLGLTEAELALGVPVGRVAEKELEYSTLEGATEDELAEYSTEEELTWAGTDELLT